MRKDPTEFRNRFAQWKSGVKVYDAGKPVQTDDERYAEFVERQANAWANDDPRPYNQEYRDNELTDMLLQRAMLNDNSYDYYNYVKDNYITPVKYLTTSGGGHFSDKYKTVYHPTFSNESQYSGKKSHYNPRGTEGGSWNGDEYHPSKSQIENGDFNYDVTREYLDWAEKNPIKIVMPRYQDGKPETLTYDQWKANNTRNALNLAYRAYSLLPQGKVLTNAADLIGMSPDQNGNTYVDTMDGFGLVGNVYGTKHYTPVNNGTLAKQIADIKNANVQKVVRPLNIIDMAGDMVQFVADAYKMKHEYNMPHQPATYNKQTMLKFPTKSKQK